MLDPQQPQKPNNMSSSFESETLVCVPVRWAVYVQFISVRRPHCTSRPQHWSSRLNRPIQAGSQ